MDANIDSFLNWSQNQLAQAGVLSPRLDSEIILAHTLKLSRTDLRTQSERVLNDLEKILAKQNIERRRRREPVSQIIGYQEFWSLNFIVNENVLSPRPETEVLVETALKYMPPAPARILDLGTGTGILSVVMAKEIEDCKVIAIDIDPQALSVAKENSLRNGVAGKIEFICSDMKNGSWPGLYSMILSNPPYIPSEDIQKIMPEVQNYEPIKALDGGNDGLDFYKNIIPKAVDKLEENGFLILEIGHSQAKKVTDLLEKFSCYKNIEVIKDYSGYDRVIKAQKESANG
ncbi:MAG: peptide chain release factor N(5)-glutamine methyltransferase [Nitrospinota bacterium]